MNSNPQAAAAGPGQLENDPAIVASCLEILQNRILCPAGAAVDSTALSAQGFRLARMAVFDDAAPVALMDNIGAALAHFIALGPGASVPALPLPGKPLGYFFQCSSASFATRRPESTLA